MTESSDNKQEQSMEEILQSIKRIIADDEVAPAKPSLAKVALNVSESEVLELTELVEIGEKSSYSNQLPQSNNHKSTNNTNDVLQAIDEHFPSPVTIAPAPIDNTTQYMGQSDALFQFEPAKNVKPDTPTQPSTHTHNDILSDIDSLISPAAADATANYLHGLKKIQHSSPPQMPSPSLSFRSGATIEDLVLEALKPELRYWLDTNLPAMVERMVAAEIKKIAGN